MLIAGTPRVDQIPQTSSNFLEALGLPLGLVILEDLEFRAGIQVHYLLLSKFHSTDNDLFDKDLEGVEEILIPSYSPVQLDNSKDVVIEGDKTFLQIQLEVVDANKIKVT